MRLFNFNDEPDVTLQLLENLGCRKILTLFGIIGQVEIEIEILVYRRNYLKLPVVRHDLSGLLRIEISLARQPVMQKAPGHRAVHNSEADSR